MTGSAGPETLVFGTDGWRDVIAERFTYANLGRAAQAYAEEVLARGGARVLVGYDTRFGGAAFARHAAQVLAANGLEVLVSQSYLPTPALAFAVRHFGADGGVMLTASHNPPQYQGFKLKGAYGGSAQPELYEAVARRVLGTEPQAVRRARREPETFDVREAYYQALSALLDRPVLETFRGTLLHDAMGGAGTGWLSGFWRWWELPGEVRDLKPEAHPLFHGVNPEPIAQNLGAAQAYAQANRVELIAATDGDADRIGVVLPDGSFFNSHQIFAVLLEHLVGKGRRGLVVKTFSVSRLIERLARARGLELLETPIGFKYIAEAMLEDGVFTDRVLIGGEESGGIGVQGHLPERDGLANSLLLLEAVLASGQGLAERFAALEREVDWRHAYDRLDLHLQDNRLKDAVMTALADPPERLAGRRLESVERLDGVKLNLSGQAWLMFRASGTEPVLRVYCEASSEAEVSAILSEAKAFIGTFGASQAAGEARSAR